MVALLVFIIATLAIVFGTKKLLDAKVHLAITFSKIRLDLNLAFYTVNFRL